MDSELARVSLRRGRHRKRHPFRLGPASALARSAAGATEARASGRVASIDALRAIALIAMIAYHFCFDLRYFGVITPDLEHGPSWLVARTLILSSFLLLAGVSLVLADA